MLLEIALLWVGAACLVGVGWSVAATIVKGR